MHGVEVLGCDTISVVAYGNHVTCAKWLTNLCKKGGKEDIDICYVA